MTHSASSLSGRTRSWRTVLVRAGLVLAGLLVCCCLALLAWMRQPCPAPLAGVPFSTCLTDREGNLLRLGLAADGRYRIRTNPDHLPAYAVQAVLLYEDRYFWQHPGVNPLSLARAALSMLGGGRRLGGSTLTMQVVRLRLGLRTGSLADKIRQMLWALRLEWHYDKRSILEAYFSLAPYGGNVEGLEAAARVYFHKKASQLTLSEVLALVPVPQNPVARAPARDNHVFLAAARRLQQDYAQKRAERAGRTEAALLPAIPLDRQVLRVFSQADLPFAAPHLTSELLGQQRAGALSTESQGSAGEVRTTLDPGLQRLLEEQVANFARRHASWGLANAAALLVHWPSREVRALVGSADFFSEAIDGQIDATSIRRSPGSTLKPFIYALALEQGKIHPKTLLLDMPRNFAGYEPENFDGLFRGPLPADAALRLSRNVPAITLAGGLAAPGLYGFLQRAHVRFLFSEEHYGLSLVLGGAEVTARELATLYCLLADGGIWRPLRFTLPAQAGSLAAAGQRAADARLEASRLLSPEASFLTIRMLESPDPDKSVVTRQGQRIPLRTKTGTSNGLRDAWTCGIVGPYVLVVWVGNADNAANPLLVGARTALPLFEDMARALAALPADRTRPIMTDLHSQIPANCHVREIAVCAATGDVDTQLCPTVQQQVTTLFIPGVSPVQASGILRRVRINPDTGLQACPGEPGEWQVTEFWPSELRDLYEKAGLPRPAPPEFGPACQKQEMPASRPPRLIRPGAGLRYHAQGTSGTCPLPLQAHADAGVRQLFWFVDSEFVGTTAPGETLVYHVVSGSHMVRVVDDQGRSASRHIEVGRMP